MLLWITPFIEFFVVPVVTLIFTILAKGVTKHNVTFRIDKEDYFVCFDLLVLSVFIYTVNMGKIIIKLQEVSEIVRSYALGTAANPDQELLMLYTEQEKLYESKLGLAIPIALSIAIVTFSLIIFTKSQGRENNGTIRWWRGIIFPNAIAILILIFVSLVSAP